MKQPDSESDGTQKCTPMGTMGSKSEGTPAGTHNFKFDDTVMGTPMDTAPVFHSPNGRIYSEPFQQEELFDDDP